MTLDIVAIDDRWEGDMEDALARGCGRGVDEGTSLRSRQESASLPSDAATGRSVGLAAHVFLGKSGRCASPSAFRSSIVTSFMLKSA